MILRTVWRIGSRSVFFQEPTPASVSDRFFISVFGRIVTWWPSNLSRVICARQPLPSQADIQWNLRDKTTCVRDCPAIRCVASTSIWVV